MTAETNTKSNPRQVIVHPDKETLVFAAASRLITKLIDIQSVKTPVNLCLTGGSVGISVLNAIAENPASRSIDWSEVHIWWGDERFLPEDDPDRNETQARAALLDKISEQLPFNNIHPMLGPGSSGVETAEQSATMYAETMTAHGLDRSIGQAFDLLLLGMGPDGHIASLFPGKLEIKETELSAVAVHNSPKPPPNRVSLSIPMIQNSNEIWLIVSGKDKSAMVKRALSEKPSTDLPASMARGIDSTLWLVDLNAVT